MVASSGSSWTQYAVTFLRWAGHFSLAFDPQPGVEVIEQTKNMDAMSDTTGSMQSPERLRAQAVAALVPFFVDGPTTDVKTARLAAEGLLDDYGAVTPKELQLATQIVALGWAALACLRTAAAAKNLSVDGMLDLQDSAIALNRSCMKATKALDVRQKERAKNPRAMTLENTKWDEGAFQLAINQALDKYNDANAMLAAYMVTLEPAAEPVAPKIKLPILSAEQMTPAVLARRAGLN
jgi:hypothetical protein